MNKIPTLFTTLVADPAKLAEIEAMPEPRRRYLIAITPRSGSSYLCDVMTKAKLFGAPGEALAQEFIPNIAKRIPGRTPDEYLRNFIRAKASRNGVAGIKASWFQFNNFVESMANREYLAGFKFIYLTRRDLASQAVSLYKATATSVFHTNIKHRKEALKKLTALEYDFHEIEKWYDHIVCQERGWQAYFLEHRIFPLCVSYEDIDEDALGVMRRIASYIGVRPGKVVLPEDASVFKKVSDIRNQKWARRFILERTPLNDEDGRVSKNIEIVRKS